MVTVPRKPTIIKRKKEKEELEELHHTIARLKEEISEKDEEIEELVEGNKRQPEKVKE